MSKVRTTGLAPALILTVTLAAPAAAQQAPKLDKNPAEGLTFERLLRAAQEEPHNWAVYGGGYDNQRYSRLNQINTENVARLQPAWLKPFGIPHGFEATPLVVDGVMYVTTGGRTSVYALDARTGEEYWHHETAVPEDVAACCDRVNRGLAVADGKVFFVTLDAQLLALDAKSGYMAWKTRFGDPARGAHGDGRAARRRGQGRRRHQRRRVRDPRLP